MCCDGGALYPSKWQVYCSKAIIFTSFVLTHFLTCQFEAIYSVPTYCTHLSQKNVHIVLKEFIECTHRFLIKASVCIIIFTLSWDVRI